MRKIVVGSILALSVAATQANATPVFIGYSLTPAATAADVITIPSSGSASTAVVAGVNVGGFNILMTATDKSTAFSSALFSYTITIADLAGPGTIYLYTSDTNLPLDRGQFTSGFGVDSLSSVGAVETTYAGTNVAFTLDRLLAQYTLTPTQGAPQILTQSPGFGAQFAMTEEYVISFKSPGETFIGSETLVNLPEPSAMALLGMGLVGLGLLGRTTIRRR